MSTALGIEVPRGGGGFTLLGFRGEERMSGLFQFSLDLGSTQDNVDPASVVGKPFGFWVVRADGERRFFHGHVSSLSFRGKSARHAHYSVEVVPWLWYLSQTSDCRIFQNRTAPQIIESVFTELGFHDYEMKLQGQHPSREYCVQYRETDLNFVQRLMEEEGMFYFFRHEQGRHVLVIGDHVKAYQEVGESDIGQSTPLGGLELTDNITNWERVYKFHPGKMAHSDFNYLTPSVSLRADAPQSPKIRGPEKYEIYEYPGLHPDPARAKQLAELRTQELEDRYDTARGSSTCRTFSPGHTFKMSRFHAKSEVGLHWMLVSVEHSFTEAASMTVGAMLDPGGYSNRFVCMPASRAYRTPRTTPKPTVAGCQTATVVGPRGPHYSAGHEVHVDDHGRVKVRFHWDRYAKENDQSSCWIRVSQSWAGQKVGGMAIPRIGQEVIVDFLEGDPDRPIIIGRVYNAERVPHASSAGQSELKRMREKKASVNQQASSAAAPPSKHAPDDDSPEPSASPVQAASRAQAVLSAMTAALPSGLGAIAKAGSANPPSSADSQPLSAAYMMTSLKSESLGGGGGSNEITMNDSGGEEGLFFKAQKDEVHTVGNDQTQSVANDQILEVGNDRTGTVGTNDTLTVGTNQTVTVGSAQSITVGGSKTEKVAMMSNEMVGIMKSTTVGGAFAVTVGGGHTVTVGGIMNTAVGLMSFEQVGINKMINVGSKIEIVCGASKLTMDSAGNITLEGVNIVVKAKSTIVADSEGTLAATGKSALVYASSSGPVSGTAGAAMIMQSSAIMKIAGGGGVDVDGPVIDLN